MCLTLCLIISGCQPKRALTNARPDLENPKRLVCKSAPARRPSIPKSYSIDWSKVQTVKQAKYEHDAYVSVVKNRNASVGAYIVVIESRLFLCSNNAQWWRDYWSNLPDPK